MSLHDTLQDNLRERINDLEYEVAMIGGVLPEDHIRESYLEREIERLRYLLFHYDIPPTLDTSMYTNCEPCDECGQIGKVVYTFGTTDGRKIVVMVCPHCERWEMFSPWYGWSSRQLTSHSLPAWC